MIGASALFIDKAMRTTMEGNIMKGTLSRGIASVGIAAAMMLGGAVPALAVTGTGSIATNYTRTGTTNPAESLTYIVSNPHVTNGEATAAPGLTVGTATYAEDAAGARSISLTFDDWSTPGVYSYTLTPQLTPSNEAGVEFDNDVLSVTYTIYYGEDGNLASAVAVKDAQGLKLSSVTPIAIDFRSGNLSVQKEVIGNLGDKNKEFDITVTLIAAAGKAYGSSAYAVTGQDDNATSIAVGTETTFHLHHGETIVISDLPDGMTYTVSEVTPADFDYESTISATPAIEAAETKQVTVENTKEGDIDTGIFLDNVPYIAILGGVAAAAIVVVNRRRHGED